MTEREKQLLASARLEIIELRKRNQIMGAQLKIVDVFAAVCGLREANPPMSIDVVWEIDMVLNRKSEGIETEQPS